MNYIVVSITCIIALVIGIISLQENEMIPKEKKNQFNLLALLIIFEVVVDTLLIQNDGDIPGGMLSYKTLKILEFIISPIIAMIFANIITRKSFWKKIRKIFIILICINAICQLITFFEPFMFSVDEYLNYSRTQFSYLYLIILALCIILLILSANNAMIQSNTRFSYTLTSSAIFLFAGVTLRTAYPNTNSDWLCITFCYLIFMIYFCNNYLKIDSLTSLLNRRAFDNKMASINYSTAIIIIDANEFKSINDTYGHQSGDFALSKISENIFKVYSKIGFCYRIGGDEFCVILRKGMLEKLTHNTENCDTYLMLENVIKLLREHIDRASKQYPVLKNGVSQGYGIYFSKQDKPSIEKSVTIEEVFKIADERMYKDKKEQKCTR